MDMLINKLQKENAEMAKRIEELEAENKTLNQDIRVMQDLFTIMSVADQWKKT